jgi:hypothetical protein
MADEKIATQPEVSTSVAHTDTPSDAATELFRSLPAGMSAWVGALQLTVLFAATGFIGKVSLQQFLGIELGNWTALDLTIFAGNWAFETLRVVLTELFSNLGGFALPAVVYLGMLLLPYVLPEAQTRWKRIAMFSSIGIVTVSLLVVLVFFEVPALSMNSWLTQSLSTELDPPDSGVLSSEVLWLQAELLASKMKDLKPGSLNPDANGLICPATSAAETEVLAKHLHGDDSSNVAAATLRTIYAWMVMICIVAWFALYFHVAIDGPGVVNEVFRAIRLFACLLLLPTVSCLVPYTYAKIIYSTEFPLVAVDKKPEGLAKPQAGGDDASNTQRFLVMDETDKDISLLVVIPKQVPYIEIEGRDEIAKMTRYGTRDVINNLVLSQCNAGQ